MGEDDMPDFLAYHKSLNAELVAIKDRVRNLVPRHWPTDGLFKESVLRHVLRRHLPESLFVGTGFIVTEQTCSRQIDVLVLDKQRPRLFCDGDLAIATPDAVRAAIEVKTGLDGPAEINSVILKAAEDRAIWYRALFGCNNIFALFVCLASVGNGNPRSFGLAWTPERGGFHGYHTTTL